MRKYGWMDFAALMVVAIASLLFGIFIGMDFPQPNESSAVEIRSCTCDTRVRPTEVE